MKIEDLHTAIRELEDDTDLVSVEIQTIMVQIQSANPILKTEISMKLDILQELQAIAMDIFIGDPDSEIDGLPSWKNTKYIYKHLKSKDLGYFNKGSSNCGKLYSASLKLIEEIYSYHMFKSL
jgi:hypothetical protein